MESNKIEKTVFLISEPVFKTRLLAGFNCTLKEIAEKADKFGRRIELRI